MLLLPLPLHMTPACIDGGELVAVEPACPGRSTAVRNPIDRFGLSPSMSLNERTAPHGARAAEPSLASLPDALLQQILGLLDQPDR